MHRLLSALNNYLTISKLNLISDHIKRVFDFFAGINCPLRTEIMPLKVLNTF